MSNGSGARCRCCDYVNVFVSVFGGGLTRFHRCDVRTAVRDSVTPLPSQPRASPVLFAFVAYTVPMSPSLLLVGSCSRGLPRDVYPPIVTVGSLPRRELGSADPAPRPSASVPRPTSPTRLSPRRSPRRSGGDDTSDLQNQSPYRAAPAHTGHGYAQPTLQEQQQQQQDPASGYLKPTAAFISRAQRNGVLFNGDGVYGECQRVCGARAVTSTGWQWRRQRWIRCCCHQRHPSGDVPGVGNERQQAPATGDRAVATRVHDGVWWLDGAPGCVVVPREAAAAGRAATQGARYCVTGP